MESIQQVILKLLKGQPLTCPIPNPILIEINELTKDLPLEQLLNDLDRVNSAILISRLPNLTPMDRECIQRTFTDRIKVPKHEWIWFVDDLTPLDPFQISFKTNAQNMIVVLRELFKHITITEDFIIILSAYYLPSPWCEESSSKIVQEILQVNINDELLQKLTQSVHFNFKNLKPKKVSKAGFKKIESLISGLKPKLGLQIEDERYEWKTSHISSISTFAFLLSKLNSKTIKDHWWVIIPTILNVLDDYEGAIKIQGVKLLNQMLEIVDPDYFKLTGLESIFYDSVIPLLSYLPKLTQTSLSVEILSLSYPTLIKLFTFSDNYQLKLIELLNIGIFSTINTVRDNHDILLVLLDQTNVIIKELQLQTLKVLPRLLYSLAMIISDPFIDTSPKLFTMALDTLITLQLNAWPRLKGHKYDILGLVVISYSKSINDMIMKKLKTIIEVLEKAIGKEELIDDYKELVLHDDSLKSIFKLN